MTESNSRIVIARVVLPTADIDAILPLYVDGPLDDRVTVTGRRSLTIEPAGSVSFGSYFNAFPAAYWQHETPLQEVRLTLTVTGSGELTVWRSDATGTARCVQTSRIDGRTTRDIDLEISGFDGGGAYWFDLTAGDVAVGLELAEWSVDRLETPGATASVAMATFNRPVECLAQLRALADDPHVREVLDRVVVVDQGTDRVDCQQGFAAVEADLGERLIVIRQRNLGGSGGFSRGMAEIVKRGESDYVLVLDDDAISEPEAIARAVRFAQASASPLLVGGGMLHLDDRSVLYTQSEQWDVRIGWVRLNRPGAYDHDFAANSFRTSPFFHRRQESDFNGWWMCLIPTELLRSAGLALPMFLKGDDVEFALRARENGVRTVTLPGIAVWHLGWGGKAPTRTWEAYFLHRNRLITALLHSPGRRPTGVLVHSLLGDLKPLLTLQYSAVRLRAQAIVDVLAGPGMLPGWLGTRVDEIRELWATYPDAQQTTGVDIAQAPSYAPSSPRTRVARAVVLARVLVRHVTRRASAESRSVPVMHVPAGALGWWTFAAVDSALVDTPDGRGAAWYRRSRMLTVRLLRQSVRLHLRLWRRWPALSREWRAASRRLTSMPAWATMFEEPPS